MGQLAARDSSGAKLLGRLRQLLSLQLCRERVHHQARNRPPSRLDFRDAWTLNPHAQHFRFHQRVIEALERQVFAIADRIIMNTDGACALYARPLSSIRLEDDRDTQWIRWSEPAESQEPVREPFRIVHVGAFYGTRTPDQLLDVLERFEGNTEFLQIGSSHPSLERRSSARVRVIPQMKHAEALALMRTASLLYLRQGWEPGVTDYIAVAAKSYEYLATGCRFWRIALRETTPNYPPVRGQRSYIVTSSEGCELEEAVRAAYDNRFTFAPHVSQQFAETFDRAALTERLAEVFDQVSKAVDDVGITARLARDLSSLRGRIGKRPCQSDQPHAGGQVPACDPLHRRID